MIPDSLAHKPDFSEAVRHWEAFWAGEIIDRPCLHVTAPKADCQPAAHPGYMAGRTGNYREVAEQFDACAETVYFGAEAIPFLDPSFGPDMFAGFVGAELKYNENETRTSWAVPFVEDWESILPLTLKENEGYWPAMLEMVQTFRQVARDRFLVGMLDLHSNMDCLAAIRGPERLCMDLLDCPEKVQQAMLDVRALYAKVYDGIYRAAEMHEQGTIGWAPFYCPQRFAITQCDFVCMIGSEHARKYVIPALREEAEFLDHTVYHYDGPNALVHLEDILAIKEIDGIQWVPGHAYQPFIGWMDLLKQMQKAGKSLQINCSPDQIPIYQKELRPEKVFYITSTPTQKEAEQLIASMTART